MIVVIEGINGAGKTTLCYGLSSRTAIPIYRPFRPEGGRWKASDVKRLRKLGVPANTHIEDIFVMDALAGARANVILDRSIVSGLAYGAKYGLVKPDHFKEWMDLWNKAAGRAGRGSVAVIYLCCSYEESVRRCTHAKHPLQDKSDWLALAGWLDATWKMTSKQVRRLILDTDGYEPQDTLKLATEFINGKIG